LSSSELSLYNSTLTAVAPEVVILSFLDCMSVIKKALHNKRKYDIYNMSFIIVRERFSHLPGHTLQDARSIIEFQLFD